MRDNSIKYVVYSSLLFGSLLTGETKVDAESVEGIITAKSLNVRKQPNGAAPAIGSLKKNDVIQIIKTEGNWTEVKSPAIKGWVSSVYVQKKSPASQHLSIEQKASIDADSLNLRSAPNVRSSVILSLPRNTEVTLLSQKGEWSYVQTKQNKTGWAATKYLKLAKAKEQLSVPQRPVQTESSATFAVINAGSLNVRSIPSTKGPIVIALPRNTKVEILSQSNGWSQIKTAQNETGWVVTNYLKHDQQAPPPKLPLAEETTSSAAVKVNSLNLRAEANINGRIVTSLRQNSQVTVLAVKNSWSKIKTSNNEIGWVASQYITPKSTRPSNSASRAIEQFVKVVKNANFRSGPGISYEVMESALAGKTYKKLGESNGWVKVQLPSNREAWIASWLVEGSPAAVNNTLLPVSSGVLKGKKIVLDAGHGGKDPGAVGKSNYEKTLALKTAKLLAAQLQHAGATVVFTREDDTFLTLSERVEVSHRYEADAFISIHYNAFGPKSSGTMSFYYKNSTDKKLAQQIQEGLIRYTNMKDLGARFGDYQVIRQNKQPGVLLELGFLSNPQEEERIASDSFQNQAVKGIYDGIINFFTSI